MAKKGGRKKTTGSKSLVRRLKSEVGKVAERVENIFSSSPTDIVSAIEEDHESLRNYLKALKDTDAPMAERRRAYASFSALLKSHTTAEESAVYRPTLKLPGHELHIKLAEGFVEHGVANRLMTTMTSTKNALTWSAHANVLSESVEHHLREEERDLLPLLRKTASEKFNQRMLAAFVKLRKKTQKRVTKKNAGVLK